MEGRTDRIRALRSYIALLRQEESLLKWLRASATASLQNRTDADIELIVIAKKITNADRELRGLERRAA